MGRQLPRKVGRRGRGAHHELAVGCVALAAASLALALPAALRAADYEAAVPAPEAVLGYALGERVTDYAGMERYLAALAEASPRVVWGSYGADYEGRELRYAVVSSPGNLARLEAIQAATARLSDPRGLGEAEAAALIDETPAVVWLNYGTDGNETAGLESALLMAHHLAAYAEPATRGLLDEAVVVLTPAMNPSSHERWASWSNSFAALPRGNPDPLAMEHHPPWGVLTNNNHYLVDLNRESFWATQAESAALRDLYYRWHPVVFVDHHGEYDDFTGPGYEEPLNPLISEGQRRWFDRFGRAIGERFGRLGWSYSPWETGSFYPGFWESFGFLNGAIGFTYETIGGGSRGLRFRREDGSVVTLELASRQHFEASLTVIATAVGARRELLGDYLEFWRSARAVAAAAPETVFVIDPAGDPARAALLLEVLTGNGIEVYRAPAPVEARGVHDYFGRRWTSRRFAAGTWWMPVDQPRARLLLTLMRRDFALPEITLAAAEEFRRNQEKAGFVNPKIAGTTYLFYDVTAWSMPLTYGVPAYWAEEIPGDLTAGRLERLESPAPSPPPPAPAEASYGYVFSGDGIAATEMLVDLLQRDVVLNVAYDGFTIGGRSFPRGSVLVRNERNPGLDLRSVLAAAGERHGVAVHAVDGTYAEAGPSMGSDRMVHVRRPRIAVLAGDPVSTRSFGDLWFTFEDLYRLEFSAVYREQLDEQGLARYDVLVLPDGSYDAASFPADWLAALRGWVSRGGTLVCFARASGWAADPEVGLAATRLRPAEWPPAAGETGDPPPRRAPEVPGAILRALPDPHHHLTFGYGEETAVLVWSDIAFEPDPAVAAPVALAPLEDLRLSGFAYEDSLARLAGTPYLVDERLGGGHLVLFLDDPAFRVYWRGLSRLLLNAVLLSPNF